MESLLFDLSGYRKPLPERVLVFASGSNRVSEIEGFAKLGIPIGVSVAQLDREALDLLIALKRPIMADSGAFSEMPSAKMREASLEISPVEWERRLAIYLRIASALHEDALLVVPDTRAKIRSLQLFRSCWLFWLHIIRRRHDNR